MKNLVSVLTLIIFLTIPLMTVTAQLPGTELAEFVVTPENPGPYERVVVKINSYAIDINRADISWTLDGKVAANGKGLRTFEFKTGDVGTKNTLELTVVSFEGYPINKTFNFYPAGVELISEAETYTPPFYRGKSYFTYQGDIRVIAIPNFVDQNGQKMTSNELVFKWKNGNQLIKDSSGLGKNIFSLSGTIPIRPSTVSVEVSSFDGKYLATRNLIVNPVEPKVIVYENNPEYGVLYNKAIGNMVNLSAEEIELVAVPYFFSVTSGDNSNLKYEWNLNGKIIESSDNSVVLKNPGTSGQASLSLQLSNVSEIFQFANTSLNINFGKNTKNLFE